MLSLKVEQENNLLVLENDQNLVSRWYQNNAMKKDNLRIVDWNDQFNRTTAKTSSLPKL